MADVDVSAFEDRDPRAVMDAVTSCMIELPLEGPPDTGPADTGAS